MRWSTGSSRGGFHWRLNPVCRRSIQEPADTQFGDSLPAHRNSRVAQYVQQLPAVFVIEAVGGGLFAAIGCWSYSIQWEGVGAAAQCWSHVGHWVAAAAAPASTDISPYKCLPATHQCAAVKTTSGAACSKGRRSVRGGRRQDLPTTRLSC